MAESSTEPHDDGRAAATAVPPGDLDELLSIKTHLSHRLARTHDARTPYAVDATSGDSSATSQWAALGHVLKCSVGANLVRNAFEGCHRRPASLLGFDPICNGKV